MSGFSLSAPTGTAVDLGGGDLTLVVVVGVIALLALAVAGGLVREVLAAGQGTEKMQDIARAVQEGASAYLRRQFRTVGIFVVLIPFLLLLLPAESTGVRVGRSIFFVVGALFSAITGYIGMWLAVRGNVRVAAASRDEGGEKRAMRIAFRTGGVAGMFTVGLGLLGAAVVVLAYKGNAPGVLEGFGFGAALLAMFMRVGGGIFTKAADVGADLVGKVEQGIPEDDPRNAATIADNVGDNVGDCAGMAADLFGSYSQLSTSVAQAASGDPRLFAVVAVIIGIVLAAVIQQLTGYFTETNRRPVMDIGKTSLTGPATVVLAGISVGLESAVYTALVIGLGVYGAFLLGGTSIMLALFAVALAGTGLLTTVGVIVAMDTFGPVSDNAQGIAEMSGDVTGEGAAILTELDAVGNTTKAITKGIAIATAVLAASALFGSYRDAITTGARDVGESVTGRDAPMNLLMDISQPNNLVGLIAGAAVVFLFSGVAVNAVSRSAG